MALADTDFSEKEISNLYNLAEEKGIPKETIDTLFLNPSSINFHLPETLIEKIDCLYDYAEMVLADGVIHEEEIKLLERFCLKFHFEEKNVPIIAQLLIEAARNHTSKKDLLIFVTQNS